MRRPSPPREPPLILQAGFRTVCVPQVADHCPGQPGEGPRVANFASKDFGGHLRATMAVRAPATADSSCTTFVPASPRGPLVQWDRLARAWELLEAREARRGRPYEVVIKVRPDATPLDWPPPHHMLRTPRDVIWAVTDHIFWGSRDAMAVACRDTFGAVRTVFRGAHRDRADHVLSEPWASRTRFRRPRNPQTSRGGAAAGTWIFGRGELDSDARGFRRRVAAAPRLGRGYSVAAAAIRSRPALATGTVRRTFCPSASRP